ncbi:arrestin domain-containing protein 3-like [Symphorus nematophorus]
MPTVQSLTMTYDALNEDGTFSEGDTITGKVTLVLSKQATVESLFVKAKGDADVRWTQRSGDNSHTYSAGRRIFKLKQFLIPESKDTVVPQGTHVYPFSIKIPSQSMPSSFRGAHGKIVYKLEAKLSRSWRLDSTAEKQIPFVSKSIPNLQSLVSSRHIGSVNREMGAFQRDKVHMDVIVDKMAYALGETIMIVAKVSNSTSNEKIRPKYSLIRDVVYRAQHNTKCDNTVILKAVDNYIKPKSEMSFRCAMKIPQDLNLTIHNCDILSVQYHVKVYLDIKFASDPEVMFPVVIYPPFLAPHPQPGVAAGPYPANAVGGLSNSDFPPPAVPMGPYPPGAMRGPSNSDIPPPAVPMGPYPASSPSGSYGQPGAPPQYPAQPANASGSYSNPLPQTSPYGSPFSSPSSVLHPPPPTAPTFPSPTAPAYLPPPSAPESNPFPFPSPSFNTSPVAPTYNLLPSAPELNTDFLSQTNDAPPSYSILFPPSATDKSDTK